MAYNNTYLALPGEIMGETEKAVKFKVLMDDDSYKTEWFPISQLASIHRTWNPETGAKDTLMASEWILKQKFMLHIASTKKPELPSGVPTPLPAHPKVPTHPPAKSFVDMDDDIPF